MLQVLMKIFQNKELLEGIKSIKTSEEICQKTECVFTKALKRRVLMKTVIVSLWRWIGNFQYGKTKNSRYF